MYQRNCQTTATQGVRAPTTINLRLRRRTPYSVDTYVYVLPAIPCRENRCTEQTEKGHLNSSHRVPRYTRIMKCKQSASPVSIQDEESGESRGDAKESCCSKQKDRELRDTVSQSSTRCSQRGSSERAWARASTSPLPGRVIWREYLVA